MTATGHLLSLASKATMSTGDSALVATHKTKLPAVPVSSPTPNSRIQIPLLELQLSKDPGLSAPAPPPGLSAPAPTPRDGKGGRGEIPVNSS